MNDKYKNFDAEVLFARKNKHCGFRFCPLCGKALVEAAVDGRRRMTCHDESCRYVFYQNPIPAAGAIIVDEDRILFVKRAHPPKIGWWCLPAGFMEWDEHPTQTAIREVREETGLEVELVSFFEVYSGHDDPRSNAILLLYLARVTGGELRAADDAQEVRFFSFDALPEKIAFASHIQALQDYRRRIRSK
ncbi:MAG: NUDIX hydrolase [candidate division Zixibacteria bacterium]|nr:NUDIX hydrolase [candidate division Zixibacteria bacterium]MDD5425065.1 NUDIX hydrolase [candidate division Zixibacteria bacterium]